MCESVCVHVFEYMTMCVCAQERKREIRNRIEEEVRIVT